MRRSWIACLAVAAVLAGSAGLQAQEPVNGRLEALNRLILHVPEDEGHQEYLGLQDGQETTTLGRIDAEILIVEIFNMYCPHCQKHAPKANELFHAIEGSDTYRGRIKLIGIGVGNSAYEVDIFRQKYSPPFPLFDDRTSAALGSLSGIKTPHYFGLRVRGGALQEIVYSQSGGFSDAGAFLEEIAHASGL